MAHVLSGVDENVSVVAVVCVRFRTHNEVRARYRGFSMRGTS